MLISRKIARGGVIDQFQEYRHEWMKELETIGTANALYRIGLGAVATFPITMPGWKSVSKNAMLCSTLLTYGACRLD